MLIKNKILVSVLVVLSFLSVTSVSAFSISPLKYTISLDIGDSQDLMVTVKNDSNTDKEYQAVIVGVQQDNQGRPIFKSNSDVAENWVKFKNEKTILKSNENKDFVFTISIPKNTPPGAHYLGLGAQENNNQNIGGRLMTIVVLQVAGIANEALALDQFYPVKKYFFNKNLVYFLQVKNIGNIDLSLKANVQTYDFRDKIIDSSPINLGNKLFAQSNRSAEIHPDTISKLIWPGRYRSIIVINYGLTNQQIIGSINFWYWPVWFLCLVGVVIVLILLFFIYKKNKHEVVE